MNKAFKTLLLLVTLQTNPMLHLITCQEPEELLQIGDHYLKNREYRKAKRFFIKVRNQNPSPTHMQQALFKLGNLRMRQYSNNEEKIHKAVGNLIDAYNQDGSSEVQTQIYTELSNIFGRWFRNKNSAHHIARLKKMENQSIDFSAKYSAANLLGDFYKSKSDLAQAEEYYKLAYNQNKDLNQRCIAAYRLGRINQQYHRNNPEAERFYLEAFNQNSNIIIMFEAARGLVDIYKGPQINIGAGTQSAIETFTSLSERCKALRYKAIALLELAILYDDINSCKYYDKPYLKEEKELLEKLKSQTYNIEVSKEAGALYSKRFVYNENNLESFSFFKGYLS